MSDFVNKAEEWASSHEQQVDQGLDKAGDQVEERTGHKYDKEVDKGVQAAEQQVHERGQQ